MLCGLGILDIDSQLNVLEIKWIYILPVLSGKVLISALKALSKLVF